LSVEKGERAERELFNILTEKGFMVIKVPLSGRAQPMPDLIVPRNGVLYGFEVKISKKKKIKYMERSYDNIIDWLLALRKEGISARAFLAVKINKEWLFEEIDYDKKELMFPSESNITLEKLLAMLKGRKRYERKLNCNIRVMGDKEDAYEVLNIIQKSLTKKGYVLGLREYVMYKDKKERKEVDVTRTRIYIHLKGKEKK